MYDLYTHPPIYPTQLQKISQLTLRAPVHFQGGLSSLGWLVLSSKVVQSIPPDTPLDNCLLRSVLHLFSITSNLHGNRARNAFPCVLWRKGAVVTHGSVCTNASCRPTASSWLTHRRTLSMCYRRECGLLGSDIRLTWAATQRGCWPALSQSSPAMRILKRCLELVNMVPLSKILSSHSQDMVLAAETNFNTAYCFWRIGQ